MRVTIKSNIGRCSYRSVAVTIDDDLIRSTPPIEHHLGRLVREAQRRGSPFDNTSRSGSLRVDNRVVKWTLDAQGDPPNLVVRLAGQR